MSNHKHLPDRMTQEVNELMQKLANDNGFRTPRELSDFLNRFNGDFDSIENPNLKRIMQSMEENGFFDKRPNYSVTDADRPGKI